MVDKNHAQFVVKRLKVNILQHITRTEKQYEHKAMPFKTRNLHVLLFYVFESWFTYKIEMQTN